LLVLVSAVLWLQGAINYKVIARYPVPGNRSFDYITIDSAVGSFVAMEDSTARTARLKRSAMAATGSTTNSRRLIGMRLPEYWKALPAKTPLREICRTDSVAAHPCGWLNTAICYLAGTG
jgi:hypothetical protein